MANTKISQLTENTNPTGGEELVYAYNNANGKMKLNTMKTFVQPDLSNYVTQSDLSGYATTSDLTTGLAGKQNTLVSGTNIRTINGASVMGSGDIIVTGGTGYTAGTGIDITGGVISATGGAGGGGYDCIVAADGTGDYTTIGAAVSAGNYNIFVKNGNYTEAAALDVSSATGLSLVGESRDGVVVTIPNTAVGSSNDGFIEMGGNSKYLFIYNMKFDITFSSDIDYFCRSGGQRLDIRIQDCDFVYSSSYTYKKYLFYCSNSIEIQQGSDLQNLIPKYPWNGVYGCTFYTESSAPNRVVIFTDGGYFNSCSFTTGASAGEIFNSSYGLYENCYFDVFQLNGGGHMFKNCIIKIKSGGLIEYSDSNSAPNQLNIEMLYYSSLYIPSSLSTAPSDGIKIGGLCEWSSIDINYSGAEVKIGGAVTRGNSLRGLYNCIVDLSGNNCIISMGALHSKIRNCGTLTIGGSSTYIGYNHNYFESSTVTATLHESSFIGNTIEGTNGSTLTIGGNYSTYLGNVWRGFTVTDSGTGNVKDNNIA